MQMFDLIANLGEALSQRIKKHYPYDLPVEISVVAMGRIVVGNRRVARTLMMAYHSLSEGREIEGINFYATPFKLFLDLEVFDEDELFENLKESSRIEYPGNMEVYSYVSLLMQSIKSAREMGLKEVLICD